MARSFQPAITWTVSMLNPSADMPSDIGPPPFIQVRTYGGIVRGARVGRAAKGVVTVPTTADTEA